MDSSERISRIQNSLKELRKTYHTVKTELAVIERRRKKIRRKERERSEKPIPGNPVGAAA
jgi:Ras-related protein Rab-1A